MAHRLLVLYTLPMPEFLVLVALISLAVGGCLYAALKVGDWIWTAIDTQQAAYDAEQAAAKDRVDQQVFQAIQGPRRITAMTEFQRDRAAVIVPKAWKGDVA